MKQIKLKAKEFKKMADPNVPDGKHVKYVLLCISQEYSSRIGSMDGHKSKRTKNDNKCSN